MVKSLLKRSLWLVYSLQRLTVLSLHAVMLTSTYICLVAKVFLHTSLHDILTYMAYNCNSQL